MKHTIITIAIFLFSVTAFSQAKDTTKPEKVYDLKITETEVNALFNTLEFSKAALPTSEASAKNVSAALQSIAALQAIIVKQYRAQNPQPKESKEQKK